MIKQKVTELWGEKRSSIGNVTMCKLSRPTPAERGTGKGKALQPIALAEKIAQVTSRYGFFTMYWAQEMLSVEQIDEKFTVGLTKYVSIF